MALRFLNWSDGLFIHATLLLMKYNSSVFVSIILLFPSLSSAQCSMCKAVAETANGGGFGAGLNYGILYLMIFPYLIIAGISYKLYRSKKLSK
jgi:hypothetical protein